MAHAPFRALPVHRRRAGADLHHPDGAAADVSEASSGKHLILRRPRSGRLEGLATDKVLVPILRDAAFGRSSG